MRRKVRYTNHPIETQNTHEPVSFLRLEVTDMKAANGVGDQDNYGHLSIIML